ARRRQQHDDEQRDTQDDQPLLHNSCVPMVKCSRQGSPTSSSAWAISTRIGPIIVYQRKPTPAPRLSLRSLKSLKALPMSAKAASDQFWPTRYSYSIDPTSR